MIQKLYELMYKIGITKGQDKVLHFLAGFVVGVFGMFLLPYDFIPYPVVAVVAVAVGKEVYDKYIKKTYFDFFDMFATICGGFVGIVSMGVML